MWGIMVAQVYFTHFHKNAPSYTHRKNFRFPFWEIPVIFPKFGKKLGKNWENISQIWETFGTLYSLLVPIEGFFWEKNTIIFSQLNLGKIMGFFPIPFFFFFLHFMVVLSCYLLHNLDYNEDVKVFKSPFQGSIIHQSISLDTVLHNFFC